MTLALTQYRIRYWEGKHEYHTVIGTNNYQDLWDWCKKKYNKFKIEEIDENKN